MCCRPGDTWVRLFVLCLVATTLSKSVRAQRQDTVQTRPIKFQVLEEVTFRYLNLLKGRSVTPSQTLKGATLEQLNSLTVADAVRYFSGVQLKDYGGIGGLKTVDTRSMGTNHTAIFYDGIQLGNAQNGLVDLARFSLDNLEEITLFNAHKGEIFQPARSFASAASIYLQSKIPVFADRERTHLKASFKTGSFGLIDPTILWEQKLGNSSSFSFSSEYLTADGRYKFRYTNGVYDTTATRSNADITALRLEAGFQGTTTDSSKWNVKVYHYDSKRGLPGAVVSNKFENGQRQWDDNFFVQVGYKKNADARFTYMINARYANDHLRYRDPEFVTTTGPLDNRYTQQEAYLSTAAQYKIRSWWEASAAVDLQWNKLNANLYRFAYPSRYTALGSIATQVKTGNLTGQTGVLETLVWDKVRDSQTSVSRSELSPFVSASWRPGDMPSFEFHGFYKQIFRLPTFNDLYYTFIGNTDLQPEYTNQYDIGITWAHQYNNGVVRYLALQSDGYYNNVKNKIVAVPTTNLYRWMMLNLGSVDIKGIDVSAESSLKIGTDLSIRPMLKYTFQEALDRTKDESSYGQQIPYVPRHSGSVVFNAAWRQLSLNYSFIYTGERYSQRSNIPVNYLQPWYTHDLSVAQKIRFKSFTGTASLEVNNLLNQYYDVVLNFPMPGRYYRILLSIQY